MLQLAEEVRHGLYDVTINSVHIPLIRGGSVV
uniref:Uncharacterized protein n=1 Tax=Anguilla anguilla TaxID=7936 RepID=A0A0E9VBR3_ANGAN